MVYRKYIKKRGRVYGPYEYSSYRDKNGRVKTKYIRKLNSSEDTKRNYRDILAPIFFILILFGILFFIFYQIQLTGKAIILDKTSFSVNEPISGKISLEFSEGSFYPSDSAVKILFNNRIEEINLKEFFEMAGSNISETEANYYSPAFTEISGYGNGYGFLGEKEVPVDVYFELKVFKSLDDEKQEEIAEEENQTQQEQQNQTGEEQEQQVEENEEIVEQEQQSKEIVNNEEETLETLVTGNIIKRLFTGKAIKEKEDKDKKEIENNEFSSQVRKKQKIIEGKLKSGEQFVYELKNKESAEIVSGSIKTADGKILDDSILIISEKEDKIIVTTDYFEKEKGFGEDYATNKKHNVDLALDIFNFTSNESGDFSIGLSFEYKNISLLKESEKIYFEENIIPEENLTEENLTEINLTGVEIITTQYNATIGKPVKWKKEIKLDEPKNLIIKVPAIAENITIKKLRSDGSVYEEENLVGEPETNLTGEISRTEELQKTEENISKNIILEVTGLFSKITGLFVKEENQTSQNEVEVNITTTANLTNYEIEYETPAPYSEETETKKGKQVKVVGLEEIKYENVLAFSEISENFSVRNPSIIKIYWIENQTYINPTNVSDLNSNGIYDYVEWIVPHLSNQTFNIILITKAEHLDENKTFISDIYEEVKELDGNWSEEIYSNEYVRITFERNLTSENDITIYPRVVNGSPRIEVYVINNEEIIAEFSSLNSNEYNKIYLTNLVGEQDSFDLKIMNGSIEIEHIIDPDTTFPLLDFVSPTPANNSITANRTAIINVSITEGNLTELKWNWNNTNYTLYNDDLVLMMNFDNRSALSECTIINQAGCVADLSTSGVNNGTLGNSTSGTDPTWNSSGKYSGAYTFDGVDDYIETNQKVVSQNASSGFTASAWIYSLLPSDIGWAGIFSEDKSPSEKAWGFFVNGSGYLRYASYNSVGTGASSNTTDSVINSNQWHFVALTKLGTTFTIYVDGISTPLTNTTVGEGGLGNPTFRIGAFRDVSSWKFNGSIDDVMVWNSSLTADEIYELYASSLTKYNSSAWNFYINQSKNAASLLDGGSYTYSAFANDTGGNSNTSESRIIGIVLTPSAKKFVITNNSGVNVASFDDKGDIYISGTKNENQGSLSAPANSFVIKNNTGTTIAYINNTGGLYLVGNVSSYSDLSGRTSSNLEIKNSTGSLVVFFDNVGNLKLKGGLVEQYTSP